VSAESKLDSEELADVEANVTARLADLVNVIGDTIEDDSPQRRGRISDIVRAARAAGVKREAESLSVQAVPAVTVAPLVAPSRPASAGRQGEACGDDGGSTGRGGAVDVVHWRNARPFVGRAAELDKLNGIAIRARGGFLLAEVVGEPGVGKTRLLSEFVKFNARYRVLVGRATEFEREVALAPFVDALVDHVDDGLATRMSDAETHMLAATFPLLGAKSGATTIEPRLFRAMRSLLRALATTPTILVLDDMHWADDMSVGLVDYLVRHPVPAPLLVVLAHRPAQISARLALTLAGHAFRVEVGPLSPAETHQLLGPAMSRRARTSLHRASGGIPLYLDAWSRSRRSPAGEYTEVSEAARAAVAAELSTVGQMAGLISQSAAVVGENVEPTLVAQVAEVTEDVVLQAFDELVERDIIRPVEGTSHFRFRHRLVQQIVYGSAAAGWRLGAHGRLAAYLAGIGVPAVVRADHVLRSAKYGDRSAAATLVEAARVVASRRPATAVIWYEGALRLSTVDDVTLRSELAFCQGLSGLLPQAEETLRSVLQALPASCRAERASAAAFLSLLGNLLGTRSSATHGLMVEMVESFTPAEAAPLRLQLVIDALLRGETDSGRSLLAAAPSQANDRWAVPFIILRAYVQTVDGDRMRAAPAVLAAASLVDTCDDGDLLRWLPVAHLLCWAEVLIGELQLALRHFTVTVELARDNGHRYFLPQLLHGQAFAFAAAGRIEDGLAAVEEALEVIHSEAGGRGALLGVLCQLNSWRGQHATAIRAGRRAIAGLGLTEPPSSQERMPRRHSTAMMGPYEPSPESLARVQLLLAQVNAGQYRQAVEETLDACGGPDLTELDPLTQLISYSLLARADAAHGDAVSAGMWAAHAEKLAEQELDVDRVFLHLAQAYAASVDDAATATSLALVAASVAARIGLPLWEAMARLLAGPCLARDGHRDQALHELQAAAAIFDACEAAELHAMAIREQRRLGVRVPHTGALANTLSPRELDVAELVCAGSTNQQIAEKLVLSVRTVETHLTHVFAKLGVTNRAGVARVLASQADD
jgi:DNA-binding CsgD family transcriptional regulator